MKSNVISLVRHTKQEKELERTRDVINAGKWGSVINKDGRLYFDFHYLGRRIQAPSGKPWTSENAKQARVMLDKIQVLIQCGKFVFAEVFPKVNQKKRDEITVLEETAKGTGIKKIPSQVNCGEYFKEWIDTFKKTGVIEGRTFFGYQRILDRYLVPFFGEMTFADIDESTLEEFVAWIRECRYANKYIKAQTINGILKQMKRVCTKARRKFKWRDFDPFFEFDFLKVKEKYREKILPFTIEEQAKILTALPEHWRPYFDVALVTGLRPGEQLALKPENIDWERKILYVRQALTLDEDGHEVLGPCKNEHSRRDISLTPNMFNALLEQKKIHEKIRGEYLFCTPDGLRIHRSNLLRRVWRPTLQKAGVPYREMKQTRHTFITMALSMGEPKLWIAEVVGHADTSMIDKTYAKFVPNMTGVADGSKLSHLLNKRDDLIG